MLCQNTCDVPLGITAIVIRLGALLPEHAPASRAASTATRTTERFISPPTEESRPGGVQFFDYNSAFANTSQSILMPFQLTSKTVLVTGAGSGIGASIADTFARAGAHVFVTDIKLPAARETTQRIVDAGGSAVALELDVTNEAACGAIVPTTGIVDILVNNAGIGHVGTALQTSGADLDR